ncbi:transposase [Sorangium sp. So ce367]|uniref:transposase n=1 Tax=Sorangium sp. So ce367 TaxID=3133305 RepID=UPI003F62B15D
MPELVSAQDPEQKICPSSQAGKPPPPPDVPVLVASELAVKRGDVVIVDGLGAHRLRGVRQALRTRGVRYWILPAYSPDLSPVENCGSKVKEALRAAAPRTVPAVYDAMVHGVDKVFRQDAQGWFALKGYVRQPRRPTRRRPVRSQAPARVGRARPPPNAGCTALERKPL